MPIYEFFCQDCHKKTSIFVKSISEPLSPICRFCGSANLSRAISSFAYHKSLQTVWEESGEPSANPGEDYYKDPRNIGRWAEKKFKDMGEEMPSKLKQEIQAAREGVMPEPLKDLQSASPTASYS
jgi:putative FmdB family regulatory protein